MLHKQRSFTLCILFTQVFNIYAVITADTDIGNCSTTLDSTVKVFYQDFPFVLQCDPLAYTLNNEDILSCVVSGESIFQLSSQSMIFNTSTANLMLYQVINESICVTSQSVTVLLEKLPDRNCDEDIEYAVENINEFTHHSIVVKTQFALACEPDNFGRASNHPVTGINPDDYQIVWRYTRFNSSLLPNAEVPAVCIDYKEEENRYGLIERATYVPQPNSGPTLEKISVDFYDSGLYTCELTYGNQQLYISHVFVCIQRTLENQINPSLNCDGNILFVEGDSKTLSCDASTTIGKLNEQDLAVVWNKDVGGSFVQVCENRNLEIVSLSPNMNAHCNLEEFVNQERICFLHLPTDQELLVDHPVINNFDVTFTLRDLTKSNAGTYTVQLSHLNATSDVFTIQLSFDASEELHLLVVRLCISLGTMILIIVAAFLIWYNKIQILLFVRRHAGQYDRGNFQYVALLVYVSPNNNFDRQCLKNIVHWVKEKMKAMNYPYLDPVEMDTTGGNSLDNIIQNLEKCHRLVVILTAELVQDCKARFQVQQAYRDMLKNRRKLIFITTKAGVKELKRTIQNAENNNLYNQCKELYAAVKACRNIPFTDKMDKERFQDHVEYALPNLVREANDDHLNGA